MNIRELQPVGFADAQATAGPAGAGPDEVRYQNALLQRQLRRHVVSLLAEPTDRVTEP
jgi:hypothetical protein